MTKYVANEKPSYVNHLHDRIMFSTMSNVPMKKDDFIDHLAKQLNANTRLRDYSVCYNKARWLFSYWTKRNEIAQV